jgi:hypothetical protein
MSGNRLRRIVLSTLVIAATVSASAADRVLLRRDAQQLQQKMDAIQGRSVARLARPVRTTITEREVNAYLVYELADQFPPGVVDPAVTILGPNRLSGRAIVDLDRVRRSRNPTSLLDPFYYLSGKLPVSAVGVLRASNGSARFQLESASVSGVPVPKLVLQQIVSYYSRSPEWPSGIDLDGAFALPASIREIQIDRGQAVVVQQ